MKLRTRIGRLVTVSLVTGVVVCIAITLAVALSKSIREEAERNQVNVLKSLRNVCQEATEGRGRRVLLTQYVERLSKEVPGLAYAVFANKSVQLIIPRSEMFNTLFPSFSDGVRMEGTGIDPARRLVAVPGGDAVIDWSLGVQLQDSDKGVARVGFYKGQVDKLIREKVLEGAGHRPDRFRRRFGRGRVRLHRLGRVRHPAGEAPGRRRQSPGGRQPGHPDRVQ